MENRIEHIEVLRELGHSYATKLAELGYNLDDTSDLMNGLAAYYKLNLKGEADHLDKAVDAVSDFLYESVEEKLKWENHNGN